MKMLKERHYRTEIEEMFTPFFALHQTKDLNTLFSILKEKNCGFSIGTDITITLEDRVTAEEIYFHATPQGRIGGHYTTRQRDINCCNESGKDCESAKEEVHKYRIVLTSDGIDVSGEVDEAKRTHIRQLKFLPQLIDLSEEVRDDFVMNEANLSERKGFKVDTTTLSYDLEYEFSNGHKIAEVVKRQFDIDVELNKKDLSREISFFGRHTIDDTKDELTFLMQHHRAKLSFGEIGKAGSVQISGNIDFYHA